MKIQQLLLPTLAISVASKSTGIDAQNLRQVPSSQPTSVPTIENKETNWPTSSVPAGYLYDCTNPLICWSDTNLGDGKCDDGTNPNNGYIDFSCYDNDNGDCDSELTKLAESFPPLVWALILTSATLVSLVILKYYCNFQIEAEGNNQRLGLTEVVVDIEPRPEPVKWIDPPTAPPLSPQISKD